MKTLILYIFYIFSYLQVLSAEVTDDWDDIDNRVVPAWYDKAKVGIFVHWGLFAVPGYDNEWFWNEWKAQNKEDVVDFIKENYRPGFTYQEFAPELTGEFFNATEWASLFQRSGAKYVVFTSKHHDGFAMWPSKYSYSFNSMDMGPHRDIVGEVGEAVKAVGLKYGIYHSLLEWFHPLYIADGSENTSVFVDTKVYPEMLELVNTYKPDIFWSDGEWERSDTYWKATQFLTWLFNESPVKDTVLTNDRWGETTPCVHGDIHTCHDRYNPGVLQSHKWENAMTIDWRSWGFRRNSNIEDYATTKQLIELTVETVSCGGNILINVGPTKEGHIDPLYQERLVQLGEWLSINGEAIYGSVPWTAHQNDTLAEGVWFTQNNGALYASVLTWPSDDVLKLGAVSEKFTDGTQVSMLGTSSSLLWSESDGVVSISMPNRANIYSNDAWVLKIQ